MDDFFHRNLSGHALMVLKRSQLGRLSATSAMKCTHAHNARLRRCIAIKLVDFFLIRD